MAAFRLGLVQTPLVDARKRVKVYLPEGGRRRRVDVVVSVTEDLFEGMLETGIRRSDIAVGAWTTAVNRARRRKAAAEALEAVRLKDPRVNASDLRRASVRMRRLRGV